MTLIDTDRAVRAVPGARLGGRDERRLGRQHDVRRGQLRRSAPRTSARSATTTSARCSATTCAPSACSSGPARPTHDMPTGRCIIVVTPDAERTMNTYLGVSIAAVRPTTSTRRRSPTGAVLYMEGYLYDRDEAKEAFRHAAGVAHDARPQGVADAVSDSFCVDRHRDDFRALVSDEVDILFGNEDELIVAVRDRRRSTRRSPRVRRRLRAGRDHRRRRRAAIVVTADERRSRCRPSRSTGCSTPPAPATCSPPGSCTATPRPVARRVRPARVDRRRRGDLPRRARGRSSSCVRWWRDRATTHSSRRRALAGRRTRRRHPRRAAGAARRRSRPSSRSGSTAGCSSAPPGCAPRSAPGRSG